MNVLASLKLHKGRREGSNDKLDFLYTECSQRDSRLPYDPVKRHLTEDNDIAELILSLQMVRTKQYRLKYY